jgi:outer membrane immunogenic protein
MTALSKSKQLIAKHIGVLSLGLLGFMTATNSASAADMAVKAVAPLYSPVPMSRWSGFYVGINGGYGWGSTDHTVTLAAGLSSGSFDVSGGILGGTFGYNQQFGSFVVGFEGDANKTWINGSKSNNIGFANPLGIGAANIALPLTLTSELAWLGTARARVGYDWNGTLGYVTGGAAFGNVTSKVSSQLLGISGYAAQSDTRMGWTIGVGVEHQFMPNLSGKLEYLYVDLGKNTQLLVDNVGFTTSIVRAGLNYRLGDLVR